MVFLLPLKSLCLVVLKIMKIFEIFSVMPIVVYLFFGATSDSL